jgi:hypothetical protein
MSTNTTMNTNKSGQEQKRTSAPQKARELAKYLRSEQPDYAYLKAYSTTCGANWRWKSPALLKSYLTYRVNKKSSVTMRWSGNRDGWEMYYLSKRCYTLGCESVSWSRLNWLTLTRNNAKFGLMGVRADVTG